MTIETVDTSASDLICAQKHATHPAFTQCMNIQSICMDMPKNNTSMFSVILLKH